MKKIYLVLSAVAISFGSYAQLNLTQATHEPVSGNSKAIKGFDSLGIVPKNSGANLLWNFSAFIQNTVNTTVTYSLPSTVPANTLFAGSTVVENGVDKSFWKSNGTTFELLGIYNPAGLEFNFSSNSLLFITWPVNFGYNMSDVASGTVSAFSQTGTVSSSVTVQGSGSGTVVLPGSVTFTNILQTKITQTLDALVGTGFSTLNINVISTSYGYYGGSQKFPLVTVLYEKQTLTSTLGPTVTNTAKIEMNGNVITVGINEVNFDASFTMFPNPTKDNFSVNLSNTSNDKGTIEIYNELGQLAKRVDLGNEAVIKTNVSVADLKPGVYSVKTNIGTRTSSRKLIVQ